MPDLFQLFSGIQLFIQLFISYGPPVSLCLSDSTLAVGSGPDASTAPQKLLILDARSYTAAVANRAKGGGCECEGKQQSLFSHTHWVHTGDKCPGWSSCCCTAVPWVIICHAAKTQHMTSKCSGFFLTSLILAQEEQVTLKLELGLKVVFVL